MPGREVQVVVINRKANVLSALLPWSGCALVQDDSWLTNMTSFPWRPTPAELHPKILDPGWVNETRLGPALAMPRPFNHSAGNVEWRLYKAALQNSLNFKILWLAKVKTLSPLVTTSSKDSLRSVFRHAFTVPIGLFGRFSINFQSLFGVPGDFNLGESRLVAYFAKDR